MTMVKSTQDTSKLQRKEDPQTPDQIKDEVIQQRRDSLEFMNGAVYSEWVEVYQSSKARIDPIMVKDETGKDVEDTSRTNICLPDSFVMIRRKVARLSRNSPNMRVRGGKDQDQREKISARLMYSWDRADSQAQLRRIIHSAVGLGWGVGKSYYDKLVVQRHYRKATLKLTREDVLRMQGADEGTIAQQIGQMGEKLSPQETEIAVQNFGSESSVDIPVMRYQGPLMEAVFVGDIFPESGFTSLVQSGYIVENSIQDDEFLEYWLGQMTVNPETGEEQPVFDVKACQDLWDNAKEKSWLDSKENNLRRQFRQAAGMPDPNTQGNRSRGKKRFMIDERHKVINGRYCADFIGDEGKYLGRNWYPWDTYGRPIYTELVLIPDLLGGIGDSTPRITKYIRQLRNVRANQTTDFINNKLQPFFKIARRLNITAMDLIRTAFGRGIRVDTMNQIETMQEPPFPGEAWQDQAQLVRELQEAEPASADFNPGSQTVPRAGQLATALELQRKSADNITADELQQISAFLKGTFELWLSMDQQVTQDVIKIDPVGIERIEALSIAKSGGEPRIIEIDPLEDMQGEFEIMPEEGSTLATDDEYKIKNLQNALIIGDSHPAVVNVRAVITKIFEAMPGVSPEECILPEPKEAQPPPPHVNIQIAFKDLPADAQAELLALYKMPTTLTHAQGVLKGIRDVADTAEATSRLDEPAGEDPNAATANGSAKNGAKRNPGNSKPNGSPPARTQ